MKIGVTGAYGLLGWHTRCYFYGHKDHVVIPAGREEFLEPTKLDSFVGQCDAIIHLAGMNRGDEAELARVNIHLTEALIAACERTHRTPHLVFSSSTHIFRDTPYGESKRKISDFFTDWAARSGALFTELVLPHIFGEGGRPFYNSAISTFCHQLAQGENPKILQDSELELLHAGSVADQIRSVLSKGVAGRVLVAGKKITVSAALEKLTQFNETYRKGIVPDLRAPIDLELFNTYRAYLYPNFYPVAPKLHTDQRGSLFEVIKSHNGGQTFLSTTKPGITRGNHYHLKKVERFCVIQGEARIRIRKLFGNEVRGFDVQGSDPQWIDIPTLHTHDIKNTGSHELVTLFWSHDLFDPANPDTYSEPVTLEPEKKP